MSHPDRREPDAPQPHLPRASGLLAGQIADALQAALQREYADGLARWTCGGKDVMLAVSAARGVVRSVRLGRDPVAGLRRIAAGLRSERDRAGREEADEGGYVAGTFNQLIRDVDALLAWATDPEQQG